MRRRSSWQRERLREAVGCTLLFTVLCLAIQYASACFALLLRQPAVFEEHDPAHWRADLRGVPPGHYFVSAGRPRGVCAIRMDDKTVATNAADGVFRDSLMLAASVDVTEANQTLRVDCLTQAGFPPGLTGAPVFSTRAAGLFLHLWRGTMQIVLGPTIAAFLLAYLVIALLASAKRGAKAEIGTEERHRQKRLAALASISLIYALSLSHLIYLFLRSETGTLVQILCRSIFSMGMFCFFVPLRTRGDRLIAIACVFQVMLMLVAGGFRADLLPAAFEGSFPFFIAVAFIAAWKLWLVDISRPQRILFAAAASWAVLQPLNMWVSYWNFWENLNPAFLTVLCASLIYVDSSERWLTQKAQTITASLLASIEAQERPSQMLASASRILRDAVSIDRVSVYVESCLETGLDGAPGTYLRVASFGYRRFPAEAETIGACDKAGHRMRHSMRSKDFIIGRGRHDRGFYVIIPLGSHGCVNLSDASYTSRRSFLDRLELLQKFRPVWIAVQRRLSAQAHGLHREQLERELEGSRAWTLSASRMAHDIQSPLTALNVLMRDADTIPDVSRRRLFQRSIDRLSKIANSLLTSSTFDTAEVNGGFEILAACERAIEEAQLRLKDLAEISIAFDSAGLATRSVIPLVPFRLLDFERIVVNLVNNAIEAMSGKGTVHVTLTRDANALVLLVADSGAGIPAEVLPRLGERGATFGKTGGHGLGLHAAREFADATNATLVIRSIVGRGTQVSLSLPLSNDP